MVPGRPSRFMPTRRTFLLSRTRARNCLPQSHLVLAVHKGTTYPGPLSARRGYGLKFGRDGAGGESLEISPHDVADVPEFDHSLTLRERIANRLSDAPMTSKDVAAALDESETNVRPMLSRMKKDGQATRLDDGPWALTGEPPAEWSR